MTADGFGAGCAWIDGNYFPIGEARIPILDTGFVRSDLCYDVVAVWQGRFFRLDDHLDRLLAGCARIRLEPPADRAAIRGILIEVVRRSGLRDAYVEAVVTRGTQRIPPASVDPTVKNFHWGDLVRGQFEAYDRGAVLPILPGAGGLVAEGPGFNVFALVDGVLRTPAGGVLEGITRRTVLELAEAQNIRAEAADLPVASLYRATELFLTSTAGGVMPVATLDGRPVGDGRPGPVTTALRDAYWALHTDPRYTTEVDYPGKG